MAQIKVLDLETEALLHSGAVPNLVLEKLCEKLSLDFEEKLIGLTDAYGKSAHFTGKVSAFPSHLMIFTFIWFFFLKNPPFDVIVGVPTLEALWGFLEFGF